MKITYSSNNSGGDWWLTDKDWYALENAGWVVDWVKDNEHYQKRGLSERWLGALATGAYREGLSYSEAVEEWESVTGSNALDEGCDCCGRPHYFYEED